MKIPSDFKYPLLGITWQNAELSTFSSPYASAYLRVYPARLEEGGVFGFTNRFADAGYLYPNLYGQVLLSSDMQNLSDYSPCRLLYKGVSEITASTAEQMSKTLRRLERRMDKLTQENNYPSSFGEWSLVLAQALGSKQAWIWTDDRKGSFIPLESLASAIDAKGQQLHEDCLILAGKFNGEITAFTTAPEDYDLGETSTVSYLPFHDGKQQFRQILVPGRIWKNQVARNQSGMYPTYREGEWSTANKLPITA